MFCLNIALGNTSWRLLFKEEIMARDALDKLEVSKTSLAPCDRVSDDFGQEFSGGAGIIGLMLEDLDQTKMAHVEMALHQARTQSLATKMAQTDQTLKADSMVRGPAIIAPMGGNGRAPF